MTTPFGFDARKSIVHRRSAPWPEHRPTGPNTRYRIQEAAVGALGIFFTPSPSVLDDQRPLQDAKGRQKACTRFGLETRPGNQQIRNLRDPLMPSRRAGVVLEVLEGLAPHSLWSNFRGLHDQRWVALAGAQDPSATAMQCPNGLRRQTAHGPTLY
jgi:hypothetical protein